MYYYKKKGSCIPLQKVKVGFGNQIFSAFRIKMPKGHSLYTQSHQLNDTLTLESLLVPDLNLYRSLAQKLHNTACIYKEKNHVPQLRSPASPIPGTISLQRILSVINLRTITAKNPEDKFINITTRNSKDQTKSQVTEDDIWRKCIYMLKVVSCQNCQTEDQCTKWNRVVSNYKRLSEDRIDYSPSFSNCLIYSCCIYSEPIEEHITA